MDIKVYHTLHKDAVKIRKEVFMEEQGFHDEFDETDESAVHLVLYIDQVPAATCRFFPGQTQGEYIVGRIAVEKKFRGNHLGSRILSAAESEIRNSGGNTVRLHAHCTPSSRQSHSMKSWVILLSENRILMKTARISGWKKNWKKIS